MGLYSLVVREGDAQHIRIIGAVANVLVAPENPAAVVDALAHKDTHLVTMTITEKGYKSDPSSGNLIHDDKDVAADLKNLSAPRTAPGFLVAALAKRREAGLPPFTAISCDNLPHNGQRLKMAVLTMARAHDEALAEWIETNGAFPQTMVDRIVPATTDEDLAALSETLGVEDQGMVKTEPFCQWVIEDHFAGERPDFAALGVQLTASVPPWEDAKLRLLNGAHSGLAYLGGLARVDFVDQMVARGDVRRFVETLWDESAATLSPPPGLDIPSYRQELMTRFANSALQHRTRQIAMDGSQKLPQRLLAPLAERQADGKASPALCLAVAAWMRWQSGVDDQGEQYAVDDPLADRTAAALAGCQTTEERVAALLAIDAIFPSSIADDAELRDMISKWFGVLETEGALTALSQL